MVASTHLAGGAAAGVLAQGLLSPDSNSIEKIAVSFGAGFLSHLLLDAFPHQEYGVGGIKLVAALFVEITTVLVLLLSPRNSSLANAVVFFGMAGGAIPDMIGLAYENVVSWTWLGNLGSKIHFYHGAVPLGFEFNFYFQSLATLIFIILVKLRPVS